MSAVATAKHTLNVSAAQKAVDEAKLRRDFTTAFLTHIRTSGQSVALVLVQIVLAKTTLANKTLKASRAMLKKARSELKKVKAEEAVEKATLAYEEAKHNGTPHQAKLCGVESDLALAKLDHLAATMEMNSATKLVELAKKGTGPLDLVVKQTASEKAKKAETALKKANAEVIPLRIMAILK